MSYRQDFIRNVAPYTAVMAQEHASSRTCPVLQKSDVVLCMPCRKHLLRGSTVLSYCVLPPVHIGQDLVYSGITIFIDSGPFPYL